MAKKKPPNADAYNRIIEHIFFQHFTAGMQAFEFDREEISTAAKKLKVPSPKNLGDVVYSFRYRRPFPEAIRKTCSGGKEWIIRTIGAAKYRFLQTPIANVQPQHGRYQIKVPDATPEIVAQHSLSDEQALLAKLRYNRLVDIFTGLATYSLQNHLRTQLDGVQLEIDELYVGIGQSGAQYIIPVQAKGGNDRIGRIQLEQDIAFCEHKFPQLTCRPVAAQFLEDDTIALFELTIDNEHVRIVEERHYTLVPASEITAADLEIMRKSASPKSG
jgi:hypothetical protein